MGLSLIQICLIGIAGALGALVRFFVGRFVAERVSSQFPWGTLLINIVGALLIGLVAGLVGQKLVSSALQMVLATGFLGGFTTFSTMHWEGVQLLRNHSIRPGILYLGGTFIVGVPVAALGMLLGGRI